MSICDQVVEQGAQYRKLSKILICVVLAVKSSQDEDQVMQEAKGESAGSEYAGRSRATDKEQPEKKAHQTAVFEGSSATGTLKGKTSVRDIAADFDGAVRKKEEAKSWMHRDDRTCERPHMIEPDAQQVINQISIYQSNRYPFLRAPVGSRNSRYLRLLADFI